MAPIIPFPLLAWAMLSAPTREAHDLVKYLAQTIDIAIQSKKTTTGITTFIATNKADMVRRQYEAYPPGSTHVCAHVDMQEMFDFLVAHADAGVQIGPVGRTGNTPASEWLVRCALAAINYIDADDEFVTIWSAYLVEQPRYAARPFGRATYLASRLSHLDAHARRNEFPGLQRALRRLPDDPEAQSYILHEYWRLSATASALWEHMLEEHDSPRGTPLVPNDIHLSPALVEVRTVARNHVSNWQSSTPLDVRRVLAQCDLEADLVFLVNHVFPVVIAPAGSETPTRSFGWEVWAWVNRAAGTVGARALDMYVAAHGVPTYFRPRGVEEYLSYNSSVADMLDDVELEPYGPVVRIEEFTTVMKDVGAGETCTICLEDFGVEGKGEDVDIGGVKLVVCGHIFHRECLDAWMNGSHSMAGGVSCPNCRTKICDARPRRIKPVR